LRDKKDVRLFFALWPDTALRQRLAEAASTIPVKGVARRVPNANLHMTLHFIGNVYFDEMDCMQRQARSVDAGAFQLEIDCQGYFGKPQVGWLGCRVIPDALIELHRQLGTCLQGCGYHPETRPYQPHVTVARKLGSIGTRASFEPITWPVREFALVEVQPVENGVQYRVVETYPMA
jgi:2'-5' RNA ligase